MYALYVTQQGLLVVAVTEEQGMKITLSFWISGVVPKTSSFWVRVNTTSTRGIKQLGIYFGSVSIFPMKVAGGHWFIVGGGYPGPRLFDNPGSGTIFSHNPWLFLIKLRSKTQLPLSFCIIIIVRNRVVNSAHSRVNLRKHSQGGGGGSWKIKQWPLFIIIGQVCAEK